MDRGQLVDELGPLMRRRVHPVWGLDAVLVAAAVMAAALLGAETVPYVSDPAVPWFLVVGAFVVAELCVVHLRIGRSAHTVSLADTPFVVGLVFVSPRTMLAATTLAIAVLLFTERGLPMVKRVFNLAQYVLAASLAIALFGALAPEGAAATDPAVWLAALVAMQCSGALGALLIAAAIALTDGGVRRRTVVEMLARDGVVTLANTTLGIVGVVIVSVQPWALVLLAVPAATVFFAYRSYILERQHDEALDLLHETTRTLATSSEVGSSIESLLRQCLRAFRADLAEVVLFTREGPRRTTITAEGCDPSLTPSTGEVAMAVLRTDDQPLGVIVVARRPGPHAAFAADEVRTLEALAGNTSVALENDHFERMAHHDALTDLPNRRRLIEELESRTALDAYSHALLLIDVDDFKTVNDRLGHDAGDQALVAVARRLRASVRPADVVARLAGDEFVVLLEAAADPAPRARVVADRILAAFAHPIEVDGGSAQLTVSVGVATNILTSDAHALLREADDAMYVAKRGGKGRSHFAAETLTATCG